ncbi:transporter substrate-binding domain-containing protein [Paucibacter sp. APW11]|uniref:Transporter substrate-binding domain-containing protein n=1 Tax=Roseateles aquae TaxID=3077235 RepID=A0ABU3PBU5_9BURK|nr:transporter substrate-binding domain-containing protein [Paucibacter sp. APW11]MDT9000036.1 transporter substrate-binding domain-containing protein [Paucibacter sp. APW11]
MVTSFRARRGHCLLALLLHVGASMAATDLLVVGTSFPQLFMAGANGRIEGMAIELLEQLAASQQLHLRYELLPWARAQLMVERGEADVLVGPYRTPEREQRFLFSQQAFYEDELIFYARRGRCGQWQGRLEELQPGSVAQVQGWAYGEAFEQARARLKPTVVRDLDVGAKMLALGRIQLLASNERNTRPVLQSLGLSTQLEPCAQPLGLLQGHFAFPRTAHGEALRQQFDAGLRRLGSGTLLRELAQRWQVRIPD